MDIQIFATTVNIEAENGVSNVLLRGVDLSMLIGQLNVEEVLEATLKMPKEGKQEEPEESDGKGVLVEDQDPSAFADRPGSARP